MVVNIVVPTRTFIETLIYDMLLILAILLAVYSYTVKKKQSEKEGQQVKASKRLEGVIVALSILVVLLGILPTATVSRPLVYFALQGILASLVLYSYALRIIRIHVTAFYVVTALLSIPLIVFYRNMFYPRYMLEAETIYITGGIEDYMISSMLGGFYYFIPIDPLILVQLSYYLGPLSSTLAIPLRTAALYAAIFLLVLAGAERFGKALTIVVLMLYITTPNLSFMDRILSLPYAFALLYTTVAGTLFASSHLGFAVLSTLIATVMVFAHPVGVFAVLLILAISLVINLLTDGRVLPEQQLAIAKNVLAVVATISATYWFATYLYSLIVPKASRTATALIEFIHNLFGGEAQELLLGYTIRKYGAPGYSNPVFYVFAYNWALPIALSIIASLSVLAMVMRRNGEQFRGALEALSASAALAAIIFIGVAYTGYVLNIEPGQYLVPAGYFSASLGAVYASTLLGKRRIGLLALALLIGLGVGLGSYTPNWASLEHENFEVLSVLHPYTSYLEGTLFRSYTPNLVVIYNDYDIAVRPGEYKDVRKALYSLLESMDLTPYQRYYLTLFIIRSDRLDDNRWSLVNVTNLLYFSNNHLALGVK